MTARRSDPEESEPDKLSEAELRLIRARWSLRYAVPRTPAERAELFLEVQQRVRNLTPEQKAAFDLRRAIARAASSTKH